MASAEYPAPPLLQHVWYSEAGGKEVHVDD